MLLLSSLIVYLRGQLFEYKIPLNPTSFTLIGLALAIFLGFRNNASYDRFWEGRKLWGALLIDSRSLTRQAITLTHLPTHSESVRYFTLLLIAFSYALKHQLRRTDATPDLRRLLPPDLAQAVQKVTFKPIRLLQEMGLWVQHLKQKGQIDSITQAAIDQNLNQLSDYMVLWVAANELPVRLSPTPTACCCTAPCTSIAFLLPFGLVDCIGWMTPIMTVFVGYTFIALDAIVTEIEEPFGQEPNDLALNTICQTIETSLLEMIGQEAPVFPKGKSLILPISHLAA